MRRPLLALALLAFACRQERPAEPASAPTPSAAPREVRKAAPPASPKTPNRSTPERCAGDGSYEQAVECFRQTSRLVFALEEEKGLRAEGEMSRTTIGAEQLRFVLRGAGQDDGEWRAEAKSAGVVWTRGNKRVMNEPPVADRIWQRTTLFIDPQKKEGTPARDWNEKVEGEDCARYHFTDANSGTRRDVWVSTTDGHIVKVVVEGNGAFPGYTLVVKKAGK